MGMQFHYLSAPAAKKPRGMGDLTDNTTNPLSMNTQPTSSTHPVDLTSPTLYECSHCPANFLTNQGLHQHPEEYLVIPATESIAIAPPPRQEKTPSGLVWPNRPPPRSQFQWLNSLAHGIC